MSVMSMYDYTDTMFITAITPAILYQRAKQGVYSEVWAGIQRFNTSDPDVLLRDKSVQFEKVKQGGYAYIMDSTPLTMHALVDSNCTVVVLKCHFLELPFGIGLQKGSPFKNLLSKR